MSNALHLVSIKTLRLTSAHRFTGLPRCQHLLRKHALVRRCMEAELKPARTHFEIRLLGEAGAPRRLVQAALQVRQRCLGEDPSSKATRPPCLACSGCKAQGMRPKPWAAAPAGIVPQRRAGQAEARLEYGTAARHVEVAGDHPQPPAGAMTTLLIQLSSLRLDR